MANKIIHELNTLSTVTSNDQIVIYNVASSATGKASLGDTISSAGFLKNTTDTFTGVLTIVPPSSALSSNGLVVTGGDSTATVKVKATGSTGSIGMYVNSNEGKMGLYDYTNNKIILAKEPITAGATQGAATTFYGNATGLNTSDADGIYTDDWGSIYHKSTTTSNEWCIFNSAKQRKFKVNLESGNTQIAGNLIANNLYMTLDSGAGALSLGGISAGHISSGQKQLYFYIPLGRPVKATPILNDLSVVVRHADGGYPYVRSGTNGGTYTALGANYVSLWTNGAATRTNEISSLAFTTTHEGLLVNINFNYQICKASGSTLAITNNIPVALQIIGTCTF